MRRLRKIVLWILGIVVALPVLAVVAFFATPSGVIASQADAWARKNLGRGLAIEGVSQRRLYPTLGADFRGFALDNASWAGAEPLIEAERVGVDVKLLPLLSGRVEIAEVRIEKPVLRATIDEEGRENWRLIERPTVLEGLETIGDLAEELGREVERDKEGRPLRPVLAEGRLFGGRVLFQDRRSGRSFEMTEVGLRASSSNAGALKFDATSKLNGKPTRLTGRFPDLIAVWNGQSDEALLTFEGDGANFKFEGAFDLRKETLSAKGVVEGSLSNDRARTAWLRQGLPEGWAPLGDVALSGRLAADRSVLDFDLTAAGEFNGRSVRLRAKAEGGENWRRGERITARFETAVAGALVGAAGGGYLFLENDAVRDLAFDVEVVASDWAEVRRWAGVSPPRRPIGAVRATASLTGAAKRFKIENAALEIGDDRSILDVSLDLSGPRPRIDGSLTEGPLDLNAFASGAEDRELTRLAASNGQPVETADVPAPAEAWSTTPLPLGALDGSDGAFKVDLKGAAIGDLAFGRTGIDLSLGDGGVSLAVKEIELYGGRIQGSASLKRDGEVATLAAKLDMQGVETEPLIEAFGRRDWLRGPIDAEGEAMGAGPHMAGLMRSLSGKGSVWMEDGALLALNFAAMSLDKELALFGAVQDEPGVTPFERASLTFNMEKGVWKTDDFNVASNVIRAEGAGQVDIGGKRVDLLVTPTGFGEISFLGIDSAIARGFPVRLKGPFGGVKVTLERSQPTPARSDIEN